MSSQAIYQLKNPWAYWQNLRNENPEQKVILLCDQNTRLHCLPLFLSKSQLNDYHIIEIPAGEQSKNLRTAEYIWSTLQDLQTERNSLLVNLGGGVVTDIGGFCASTYVRGIPFIHVPTSLLAMVDAAIGGKTGIDFNNVKNAIGTFCLPETVLIDALFLDTLSHHEMMAGYAELVKHAILCGGSLWEEVSVQTNQPFQNLSNRVALACQFKIQIVEADPNEKGIRKALNFGHTYGHAIESCFLASRQYLSHGMAVAAGMWLETKLSLYQGLIDKSTASSIESLIENLFPALPLSQFSFDEIFFYMQKDKKIINSRIGFALPTDIGRYNHQVWIDDQSVLKKVWDQYVEYGSAL
jgi:3-dehydroquinate synthase